MLHGYSVPHISYAGTLFTSILPGDSVYSMQLFCATYILNGYFVLPLFYTATLLIYILHGYSVLHSTWPLCLHIFYACPAPHIFIFNASLTALISLFCTHSSTLNSPPSNSRGFEIHIIHSPQDHR